MRRNLCAMVLAASALLMLGMAATGDDYTIDTDHSGVVFKISHSDLSWIFGRFNNFSGEFTIDPSDPSKSSFTMKIKPESVDTNNTARDGHLKQPRLLQRQAVPVHDVHEHVGQAHRGRLRGDRRLQPSWRDEAR